MEYREGFEIFLPLGEYALEEAKGDGTSFVDLSCLATSTHPHRDEVRLPVDDRLAVLCLPSKTIVAPALFLYRKISWPRFPVSDSSSPFCVLVPNSAAKGRFATFTENTGTCGIDSRNESLSDALAFLRGNIRQKKNRKALRTPTIEESIEILSIDPLSKILISDKRSRWYFLSYAES